MITDGFLVVDKEPSMTSHDVVAIARRALNTRRVGHAGTLDPMATGVLVLGFGVGTRLLQYITEGEKEYTATICLGISTVTDDAEGEVVSRADISGVGEEEIQSTLAGMVGTIMQRPSSVSAVRIDGERAYDLVREGKTVEIPARSVTISQLDVHGIRRLPHTLEVDISVHCSAGTFIRAIARDAGQSLGVGGHLTALRRTRVGRFTLEGAISIRDLKEGSFHPLSVTDVAMKIFPVRFLSEKEEKELGYGKSISPSLDSGIVAAISKDKKLIALLENVNTFGKPVAVFASVS